MTTTAPPFKITGLCAAPFTPFHADGSVDLAAIPLHVEELLRQGVSYAFVNGTTGEGVCQSVAERKAILQHWAADGRIGIIAHVAAESIVDVAELAAHAESCGVVAIAAHTTTFNKPHSLECVVEGLAHIAKAAPRTPLYFYYISVKTGYNLRCDELLAAIHSNPDRVPTFCGIKFTDFDMYVYANCVAFAGGRYDCLSGRDEVLLSALVMGATGAVGSTYNYMGRVYNSLIAKYRSGDLPGALAEQRKSHALVDILNAGGKYGAGANIGKAVMELRLGGRGCGPPRYPAVAMADDAKAALRRDLDSIGFFEW